jgi:hypothetical protein
MKVKRQQSGDRHKGTGDRHKGIRVIPSGHEKRKKAKEESLKHQELRKNTRRMTEFIASTSSKLTGCFSEFVCLLFNGTSALCRLLVPRTVEIKTCKI